MKLKNINLSPIQETILRCLMCRPITSIDELIQEVYQNPNLEPDSTKRNLRVIIFRLRKKLKVIGWNIITFPTRGYGIEKASR